MVADKALEIFIQYAIGFSFLVGSNGPIALLLFLI